MFKTIFGSRRWAITFVIALAAQWCGQATAAPFSSGSNGSDGALTIPIGDGSPQTVIFNPATHGPPIDTDFDGIYNFTTITIPANITLQIRATEVGWVPMYWLATGNVQIAGKIDIRGNDGHDQEAVFHVPSIPGPGGYPGGTGGVSAQSIVCSAGFGPGPYRYCDGPGTNQGNNFLFPLPGGSGGGGANSDGPGGGAGGGAILIASTTSISIGGSILANGGNAGFYTGGVNRSYGCGAAGAIRLVAPTISGAGILDVTGGKYANGGTQTNVAFEGRVRLESNQDQFTGTILCSKTRRVTLVPSATHLVPAVTARPVIRVTTVNEIAVTPRPGGSFALPDVTFDSANPVTFDIQASGIPPGTTSTLFLWNQNEYILSVAVPALAGTLSSSTTSVSTTVPSGLTQGFVYATWTP